MSDTTTPKRNEAVALWVPNGHKLPDGSWESGPGELVSIDEASDFQKRHGFPLYPQSALHALQGEVSRLRAVVDEARRAIGDHHAPNDCYATGPLTGDEYSDLVQCPACSFLAMFANLEPPNDGR